MADHFDKSIHVTLTSGTILRAILFVIFFGLLFLIMDIVMVVLAAVVLASAIEPITQWLGNYNVRRLPAVLAIYLAMAFLFSAIFYFFLPPLLEETSNFLTSAPRYMDSIGIWDPFQKNTFSQSQEVVQGISQGISDSKGALRGISSLNEVANDLKAVVSNFSEGFVRSVSVVFGGILSFVLIVVISFYLSVQEDGVAKFLRIVTPLRHEKYVIDLWKRSQTKIGRWMQGQLLLAIIVGVLVFLGLSILGVRNALLLAVLAAIFETIPLFGPVLAAIPAIAIAYLDGGVSLGLFTVGLYLIIQQFENHLIYPLVVKKIVGVPPILVILALIVGAKLAGFLGILLSVPVAATLMEYLDDVQKYKLLEEKA